MCQPSTAWFQSLPFASAVPCVSPREWKEKMGNRDRLHARTHGFGLGLKKRLRFGASPLHHLTRG
jgi:hypothetical protein